MNMIRAEFMQQQNIMKDTLIMTYSFLGQETASLALEVYKWLDLVLHIL
jgi:hypothetical protein